MRKTLAMVVAVVLLFSMLGSASAATSNIPTFKVDGKLFVTPAGEPQPYINKDNRTMGSLRLIANALGVEDKNIKWDSAKNTATLTRGSNTVSVTVGKKVITVNGKSVTMDTVAEKKQGRVFIPARFIGQGLGVTVKFESATNTVNFITGEKEVVNNNFSDYGMKQLEKLPITLTANNLEITYHEAFLYKTTSAEGKSLNEKYGFPRFDLANHVLFMKVTITNKGTKNIAYDYSDLEQKIGATYASARSFSPSLATKYTIEKNGDYINTWSLEPGKSFTGNIALLKNDNVGITFIELWTANKNSIDFKTIAEKVE